MHDRLMARLTAAVGPSRVHRDAPLAPLTTFRIGGPADCLVEVCRVEEVVQVLVAARECEVRVHVIGGGSNVLVADEGVRGLVVRVAGGVVAEEARGVIRAGAGLRLNGLIRWAVARGFGGLEAWAGTPGTVGGAVVGNAHFGGRSIGDLVVSVHAVDRSGRVVTWSHDQAGFDHDGSRMLGRGHLVVTADFGLESGRDPVRLRETARASLMHRKRTQPLALPSAGCVFTNPDPARDRVPEGIPWSAGALLDRAGLKGRAIGGARVSPVHANFIVNEGGATAADVAALIRLCRLEVRRQFGVELLEEIRYLGAWPSGSAPMCAERLEAPGHR